MPRSQRINGVAVSWSDIEVEIFGVSITGFTELNYGDSQSKTNIYARGNMPYLRGRGNVEFEGSITLLFEEYQAIREALGPGVSLRSIPPFTITITYQVNDGTDVITDVLEFCEFTESKLSWSQGDDHGKVPLPLIIGNIRQNV